MTTETHNIRLPLHPARKRAYVRAANGGKLLDWIFKTLDREAVYQPSQTPNPPLPYPE